jgi:hypothetical protein
MQDGCDFDHGFSEMQRSFGFNSRKVVIRLGLASFEHFVFVFHNVVQSFEEVVGIDHKPFELRRSVASWSPEDLYS